MELNPTLSDFSNDSEATEVSRVRSDLGINPKGNRTYILVCVTRVFLEGIF